MHITFAHLSDGAHAHCGAADHRSKKPHGRAGDEQQQNVYFHDSVTLFVFREIFREILQVSRENSARTAREQREINGFEQPAEQNKFFPFQSRLPE